jgi:cysteinyl-tRNA synthetase
MLKLYNSYSNSIEKIDLNKREVKIYLCGPTVQSSPHLGHGRSAVVFDFFVRYLKYLKYNVIFVRNITDIDDKIIEKSFEENISYKELAMRVSKEFDYAYQKLNCIKPDEEPRATEFIKEIISYIETLIKNEYAYITKSGVYYDISKFDEYLLLSGRTKNEVISGTRVELEEDKNSPEDFALWKFSKENEPYWESPWGNGRPGWHIECSSMIEAILGKTIDFHCGGNDLIFPHHENEIAQSKGAHPKEQFVKYWLHNGMLNLSGKKMSKSDGNVKLLNEYIDEFSGPILRFFFLKSQYRSPQEFNVNLLKESESTLNNLIDFTYGVDSELKSKEVLEIFEHSMNEDLNTPKMLGSLFKLINESDTLNEQKLLELKSSIKFVFNLLGFDLIKVENNEKTDEELTKFFKKYDINFENVNQAVSEFINKREDLRKQKDFESADKMRESILGIGISLEDGTDSGWSWKNS